MTVFKESLDTLTISDDISGRWPRFRLKWVENSAGFDIFDLNSTRGGRLSIGDDADFLHLFMIMADRVYQTSKDFKPLLISSTAGGSRLFVRPYTAEEKQAYKYAYVTLGNAVKQLPESTAEGPISFFAEVKLEKASSAGFEKEAAKAARSMPEDTKAVWQNIIEQKSDFLKTDLYVFQLLKLFSWGFQIVGQENGSSTEYCFVRAKRPQPRGASRH